MTLTSPSRQQISATVGPLGWRLVMASLASFILVDSLNQAADVAARIATATGIDDQSRLRLDLRPDRVLATVKSPDTPSVTAAEVELARRISTAVNELGLTTDARAGSRDPQVVELAIDALDAAAIRPFWLAALGYTDDAGARSADDPIADPFGQGPTIWFQKMDAPRPQRNRIHLDIAVPDDEAALRIAATLAAGGRLVNDTQAPAFWVLADTEGNEACICTWQGRD